MDIKQIYLDWKQSEKGINYLITELEVEFNDFKARSITWSEEDFERRARSTEEVDSANIDWEDLTIPIPTSFQLFNRSKFKDALEKMIYIHDCEYGITSCDIDFYLEEYCKKKGGK